MDYVNSKDIWLKETITTQEFPFNPNKFEETINEINESLLDGEICISLNEYLNILGLEESALGDLEWNVYNSGIIKYKLVPYMRNDKYPGLAIEYRSFPRAPIKHGDR